MSAPDDGGSALISQSLTLRDWFAGQALTGWLASFGPDVPHPSRAAKGDQIVAEMASEAYILADAMLAERAKGAKP